MEMQQIQIIGISILPGGRERKIVYININEEGGQDRSQRDAVSQTSKLASLVVTSGENKASISDKLQDHPNHALIREKSQQLAGDSAVPDSVIKPLSGRKIRQRPPEPQKSSRYFG